MEYDPLNRLVAIYAAIGELDFSEASLIVSYEYNDEIGTVKKKTHYVEQTNLAAIANEISYEYDQRNRLTNITAKKPGHNPVMDYDLFYDDQVVQYSYGGQQETVTHDQNWNGNINGTSMDYNFNAITAFTAAPNDMIKPLLYGYKYDPMNRMTQADATVGDFIQTGSLASQSYQIGDLDVNYDKIGNIISLHRTMLNDANDPINYLAFDHFNYVYGNGNNRLISVQGLSGSASRNYTYDEMGNLVSDDARDMVSTKYARTAYPYQVTKDNNGDTEIIDYLYSIDDQRIYKRFTDNLGTKESYYLKDAFGSTVAIYVNNTSGEEWSYFISGSERECEITPHGNFTPFTNSGVTYTPDDVAIGVDMIKFYLYDHLGNTRITYTPDKVVTLDEEIIHDDFLYGSFDDWHGKVTTNGDVWVDLENTSNALAVTVEPQAVNGVSKNVNYLSGGPFAYDVTIDVDLGSTSGLEMSITNALPNTQTLTQGVNTFTITPSAMSSVISILPTDNSQTHNFTINSMVIEKQNATVFVTQDDINQVVDYYPYGKVLREYINGDQERYLTTQHERDQVTGLDYRGARYYDADVARFLSLDPLASDFPAWSAYNYVMGNPVMLVDPDGRAPQDWVKKENNTIYWDNNANDQSTTKEGETYLGKELSFVFNSYIDKKLWDGPGGSIATGDKLTSTITLKASENASGEMTGIEASYATKLGDTPVGTPRSYYPGEGGDVSRREAESEMNKDGTVNNFKIVYEQHASVSAIEESGLRGLGYKIVDVSQKLVLRQKNNYLWVGAYTNIFPSATVSVNGHKIIQYDQPSFVDTHRAPYKGSWTIPYFERDFSYYKSRFYKR